MKKLNLISPFCFRSIVLLLLITINVTAQPQWISSQVSSNNGNNSSNNPTFNRPASLVSGDLLLVTIVTEKGNGVTFTPPSGWILILSTSNSSRVGIQTYYKVVQSSEPNSYTFTMSTSSLWTGSLSRFTNIDATNPIGGVLGGSGNSGNTVSPSLQVSNSSSLIISLHGRENTTTLSAPSGTDLRYVYNSGNAARTSLMATFLQPNPGSTGSKTTSGGSGRWVSQQIALNVRPTFNWLGTHSSNWNDTRNWSQQQVPHFSSNLIIGSAPFQPEITTHAQAYSLTVDTGGSLVVKNGSSLTLQGAVSVAADGSMLIENGANLVQVQNVSNSGSIRVQKSTRSLLRLDYVIWSSPVSGSQTLKQFSPQTLDNRFYAHQLPSNTWVEANTQLPFAPAKGYMIRVPNTHPTTPTVWTGQFVGTPQNGTLTVSMPAPRNNNQNRYFLVGNPYPSALDMKQFLDINAANITGVYYFYRKTNGVAGRSGYFIKSKNPNYNPNDPTSPRFLFTNNGEGIDQNVIPSGQGFFVEMAQGASQIVFTNAMRVAVESGVLNRDGDSEDTSNRYTLNVTDAQGGFSQIQVGHYEATTAAYDSGYDTPAFEDSSLLLGSLIANQTETFAVQALDAFDASVTVPLRFKTQTAGTFTLTLADVSGLFAQDGTQVMLEDLTSGVLHSLTEAPFVFTSEAGDFTSRFRIVYQQTILGLENPIASTSPILAYAQEGNLYVKSSQESIRAIAVYNLQGQLLTQTQPLTGIANVQLPLNNAQGQLVLVQVQTVDGSVKTHKVWVNSF